MYIGDESLRFRFRVGDFVTIQSEFMVHGLGCMGAAYKGLGSGFRVYLGLD